MSYSLFSDFSHQINRKCIQPCNHSITALKCDCTHYQIFGMSVLNSRTSAFNQSMVVWYVFQCIVNTLCINLFARRSQCEHVSDGRMHLHNAYIDENYKCQNPLPNTAE